MSSDALEFAFLSQVSHGGVLALKELSDAIFDVDESFLQRATRDGVGIISLLTTANRVGLFIHLLVRRFKIAVDAKAVAFITKLDEMIKKQGGNVLRPTP